MPGQFNADQTQFACIGGLHEGYSEIEIKLTKGGNDFISYVKMGTVEENELNSNVAKYEKKLERVDNLKPVEYGALVLAIVFIVFALITNGMVGGSFSKLRKVDCEDMNLSINAYYVVRYEDVDQVTLTVFVKNNSDKSLRSAQITQKGTNNTAIVRNIDSGEEKIVTIDTYYSGDYEFMFENIEFVE